MNTGKFIKQNINKLILISAASATAIVAILFGISLTNNSITKHPLDIIPVQKIIIDRANSAEDVELEVEIADSPEERSRGLMYRTYLDPKGGMLFIFSDSELRSFWMKNTLISLDMIFI